MNSSDGSIESASSIPPSSFFFTWLSWTLGSTLADIIALALTFGVIRIVGFNEDTWGAYLLLPLMAVFISLVQALILARHIQQWGWWVVCTVAGWLLTLPLIMLMAAVVPQELQDQYGSLITLIIFGTTTGVIQWIFLRRYWRGAFWWFPVCLAGWVFLGILVGPVFTSTYQLILIGLVPSATTGLLIAWWFARQASYKKAV